MADRLIQTTTLTAIADAIRAKNGSNSTYTPAQMATAISNISSGLHIKKLTATVSADKTSTYTLITDPALLEARNDPNGFVLMRYMGLSASTAEVMFWFTANFNIGYGTNTAYNSLIVRATASGSIQANFNTKGLVGENYNSHINIDANGSMVLYNNATYPLKAGNYEILAGLWE